MISPEKESVTFTRKIDVNDGEKKGNVEIWLSEIEREMRSTLKKISQ
jgi:dynein heavy chain